MIHHPTSDMDFAVLGGKGKRLQTRTRQTFWDKMLLTIISERHRAPVTRLG
jgi:hypothetical protein